VESWKLKFDNFMQKRYWLKGGIIVLLIATLLFVCLRLLGGLFPFLKMVGFSLMLPGALLGGFLNGIVAPNYDLSTISVMPYLFFCIVYFVFGAIIGWLYGKIKNRSIHNS
jgi:hypothetical protein